MLHNMDASTRSDNQCAIRLDAIVPCAMEVQMNETPNYKTCPLIQRVREVWSLMEMEGLDDSQDDIGGMELTISIFTFHDDEEDDDLPLGATQITSTPINRAAHIKGYASTLGKPKKSPGTLNNSLPTTGFFSVTTIWMPT